MNEEKSHNFAVSYGRRALKIASIMIILMLSFIFLREGKGFFIPLVIALLGVYLILILARWIGRLRLGALYLPRWIAALVAVAVVIGFGSLFVTIITDNAMKVIEGGPRYQERFSDMQMDFFHLIGIEQPPAMRELLQDVNITDLVTLLVKNLMTLLKTTTLILVLGVFVMMEAYFMPRKFAALFPDEKRRSEVGSLLDRIDSGVQTYFGVKTAVSLATSLVSYIVLRIIGLDFAEFWALLVFILNFIPTIGSIVATVFPALFSLVQFSDSYGPFFAIILGVMAIQLFFGNFLEPNLMGISLNLSPLVVVLSLIFWGLLWGVVGMFLCVPITAIAVIIMANFPSTRWVAILLSRRGDLKLIKNR